jgi:glycosyltransferase involved in cell wall biosynthesis
VRIAFMGLKGLPARWGGIERYVEEVSSRLAGRGHEVSVYASRWYSREWTESVYRGVRLRRVSALNLPATEALSHALLASAHAALRGYDVIHLHNFGSYYLVPLLRALGHRTFITAHGGDEVRPPLPGERHPRQRLSRQ